MTTQGRIWLAVALASLGWGTSGVMTRVALGEDIEPFAIAAGRSVVAAAGIAVWLLIRRRSVDADRTTLLVGIVMATTNMAAPLVLGNLALQYAGAGFVGVLASLIPLFTAVIAHFALPDEPMRLVKVAGLVVALSGVVVLFLSGDSGLGEGGRPLLAGGLALCGYLAIAVGSVYAKKHAGAYRPLDVSVIQFVVGGVLAVTAMLLVEGVPDLPAAGGLGSLLYLGTVTTVLPFLVYYWLLQHVTVTYSAIIGYLVPLVAVIVGVVALDERLQPGIVIGGALILAGVIVTDRVEMRTRVQAAVRP